MTYSASDINYTLSPPSAGAWRACIPAALFTLLTHSNIFASHTAILFAGIHYSRNVPESRVGNWLLSTLAWSVVTACTVTGALMAICWGVGRSPWFFMPQLKFMIDMSTKPGTEGWWVPFQWSWLVLSPTLAFLSASGCVAAVELVRLTRSSTPTDSMKLAIWIHIGFLVSLLTHIAGQAAGQTLFQELYPYFAYPVAFPMLLSWGAIVSLRGVVPKQLVGLTTLSVLLAFFLLAFGGPVSSVVHLVFNAGGIALFVIPSLYVLSIAAQGSWLLPASFVVYPLLGSWAAYTVTTQKYSASACHLQSVANDYIMQTSYEAARLVRDPGKVFVWTAEDGREIAWPECQQFKPVKVRDLAYSLANIGHRYLGPAFPFKPIFAIPDTAIKEVKQMGGLVLMVGPSEADMDEMRALFKKSGASLANPIQLSQPLSQRLPAIFAFQVAAPSPS